ncbi:MAG: prenyltransferase [Anaerolineae bacterium]|nr:prenyltransferase [Anaerolineae bacterium]
MNTSMWVKALRIIPRISKEEWIKLDLISRWLVATRSAVIIMTFTSAAIGGLLAFRDAPDAFSWGRWLLAALGLVLAHATNNMVNDLTDFKRGVDQNNYYRTLYGPQPVQQGLMSQRELLIYISITGIVAVAAGIPLVLFGGLPALLLMLFGIFFVLFYTFPLKYIALGEAAVLLIWGPLMVVGTYYVSTGISDWNILAQVALASLPYGLGATAVIFGKHIDKLEQDRAKKIYTLPVVIGEKAGRWVVRAMFVLMYLLPFYLVMSGYFTPMVLMVLLALPAIPRIWKIYSKPRPNEKPDDLQEGVWPLWFSAASFTHTRSYGLYFMLGLILDVVLKRLLAG